MPVVPHSSNTTSCGQGVNIVGAPGEGARGEDKDRHRSIVRPQVSLTEGMQSLGGGFAPRPPKVTIIARGGRRRQFWDFWRVGDV